MTTVDVQGEGGNTNTAATSTMNSKRAKVDEEEEIESEDDTPKGPFELVFKENDLVLARHGPLQYLAKVLDADVNKGYLIHYDGWNSRWDEWVTPDRVVPNTEENKKKAAELKRDIYAKAKRSSSVASTSTTGSSSKKKRESAAVAEDVEEPQEEEANEATANVRLVLSDEIKTLVIRDWEQLTQNKKLCILPKPEEKSVERIMKDFTSSKKSAAVFNQIAQGILVYFDKALPSVLLYRSEKAQYDKLKADNPLKRNCQLFGGEHLLRLFVRLPQLLMSTDLDDSETKQLCSRLQDMLRFLSKKAGDYFPVEGEGYMDNNFSSPDNKQDSK